MDNMPDSLWNTSHETAERPRQSGPPGNTDPAAPQPGAPAMFDENGELIWINGHAGRSLITIAVPTYRDDASRMIRALSKCDDAERTELVIYDDGSENPPMRERMWTVESVSLTG